MKNSNTTFDVSAKDKDSVKTLNHLIEICKDGEKGFESAADGLDTNSDLRTYCVQNARERAEFARELQVEVRRLDDREPASSGTLSGALHRGWLDIKAAVTDKDETAIINECERGEDVAKEAYEAALGDYLPTEVTELIKRQYRKVLASHDYFSALKKRTR